jgi:hypothetical protein
MYRISVDIHDVMMFFASFFKMCLYKFVKKSLIFNFKAQMGRRFENLKSLNSNVLHGAMEHNQVLTLQPIVEPTAQK